jgi:hypothetical protein
VSTQLQLVIIIIIIIIIISVVIISHNIFELIFLIAKIYHTRKCVSVV